MARRISFLFLASLAALSGCGPDQKVTVGKPGEKGEYRRDIDRAKEISTKASQKIKQGESDVYGG